jgi:cobalt-zinc-cadmium efflux system outer membrane protein
MKPVVILSVFAAGILVLSGCRGIPTPGEKQARHNLAEVASQYRPTNSLPMLPELTPDSSLSNFLAYALLNSPTVEAAFYDWSASVENITVTRSMPDPQLSFQAYIQHSLTSLMPGFIQQIPGPGKLKVRARVAAAESDSKYFAFESALLQAALDLKKSYYKLGLVDEQLRLNREMLGLLENLERTVRAQNETGQAALTDVLSVQSDLASASTALANLEDSRRSLLDNFKAALGLSPQQSDPPTPAQFEFSRDNPDVDELLRGAFARNPQLNVMAAEVRAAEAGIAVAYKERVPDFNVSLWAEVYHPPFYWPQANMTVPLWRDKIAAEIAQAKANELVAQARLTAAQIDLAVSLAEKSFAYRESSRNLALIEDELIPNARQSLEIIRAGYRANTKDFSSLTDAERRLLDLQLSAAGARTEQAIALAELTLLAAGVPPAGAPLLSSNHQP